MAPSPFVLKAFGCVDDPRRLESDPWPCQLHRHHRLPVPRVLPSRRTRREPFEEPTTKPQGLRAESEAGPGAVMRVRHATASHRSPRVRLSAAGTAREGRPLTLTATRSGSTAGRLEVLFEILDEKIEKRVSYRQAVLEPGHSRATATYIPPYDGGRDSAREFTVRIGGVRDDPCMTCAIGDR